MKSKGSLLCVALFLALSEANAQSSVTMFGVLDEGINYTSNALGHSTFQMHSGDAGATRWGLKGQEDLGGGYATIFTLENGFNINTGNFQGGEDGRIFGRQSWVGLRSNDYGTLTLGRQLDPSIDLFSDTTGVGRFAGSVASHPFDNDNTNWDFRVNNAVKYVSPTVRGFTVEGMYALSNTTIGQASNRLYSAGFDYLQQGLKIAVVYLKANNQGSAAGAVTTDSVFAGESEQHIDAGVSYTFSRATVGFAYSRVNVYQPTYNAYFSSAGTQPPGGTWNSWKFDNFDVNAQYTLGPDITLGASYVFTNGHLAATNGEYSPKWHQVALMGSYSLSKSTAVYLQGAYQHVVSAHTGTDFDFAQVAYAGAAMSSGENQAVVRLALLHTF
ncbi:porin [Paraburkholderia sp. Ac-20340]|uniref:porin n=1 Tax=Paraburkholderia sp. Ac-20340 TaxID=2703888 RepID=UPI00197DEBA2|nr:porin [Paraburkholderia sp. Ac-20340]MBN3856714.1 porin [Paraburkholderia sp. Ac-20340]